MSKKNREEDEVTRSCYPHDNNSITIMGSFATYHLIGHKTIHFIEYGNNAPVMGSVSYFAVHESGHGILQ